MTTLALDDTRPEVATDPGLLPNRMLIGGQWCDATDGETLVVETPGRREPIGTVPRARAADVDRAVAAAAAAFPAWSRTVPRERGRVLLRIADALEERLEELARLIARETGNALRTQARGEARFAADSFRYFGGLASDMRAASDRLAPVSLELGGKSPSIVFPDADEDWVVDGIIASMRFTRQSQSCTAGSRLFLHRSVFDGFLDKLVARTEKLAIGDPLDEATDIGSIINARQFEKVCGYVQDGLERKEARLV